MVNIIAGLGKQFPEIRVRAMAYIGARSKELLKKKFLSGQELNLEGNSAYTLDKSGRKMISYTVARGGKSVRIASYPTNLYEFGRGLRSGATEPGRKILTVKLKSLLNPQLQGIINEIDIKIIEKDWGKRG
jgi:hypothetical protein